MLAQSHVRRWERWGGSARGGRRNFSVRPIAARRLSNAHRVLYGARDFEVLAPSVSRLYAVGSACGGFGDIQPLGRADACCWPRRCSGLVRRVGMAFHAPGTERPPQDQGIPDFSTPCTRGPARPRSTVTAAAGRTIPTSVRSIAESNRSCDGMFGDRAQRCWLKTRFVQSMLGLSTATLTSAV